VNKVQVHGPKYYEALGGEGIEVTERYSSEGGPFYVEESEPIIYFRNEGFLHRMFMTLQAGKLVQASGSGDTRYLPVVLDDGAKWESATQAFRVGGGMSGLGFNVSHRHSAAIETKAVQVPAGSFEDCVRIDTYSTQGPGSGKNGEEIVFYYSDWYAPGVGLIRTEQWDDARREKERTRIELLEYEVAPAAREPAAAEKTS
jgi:hypothetical protein